MELFHLYLFVTIANVIDTLNHIFFLQGECHPLLPCIDCRMCPSISSGTVPLNFVWLSHSALSFTINLFIVSFSFIHYPYLVWTATPFCLLSEWNCATLLCVNVTQIPCVFSPLSLCEFHTCASPFSLCECHTNILVSQLLLSGRSTLFPFRSYLTRSRSYLVWTTTPHFLNEKSSCPTSFLSFGNITNLFITIFLFPM